MPLETRTSEGEVRIDTLKIWACLSVLCHQLWLSVSFARKGIMELIFPLLFPNCWSESWMQSCLWWEDGSVLGTWKVLWCCVLNLRLKNWERAYSPPHERYTTPLNLLILEDCFLWKPGKSLPIHQHFLFAVLMNGFLGQSPLSLS